MSAFNTNKKNNTTCITVLIISFFIAILNSNSLFAGDALASPRPRDDKYLQEDLARLAKEPKNPVYMREAGISYNVLGAPDNVAYLKKAKNLLEEANKIKPQDPSTLLFLGSTYGLLAKSSETGMFEKKDLLTKSFDLMDKAIALEPNNFRNRLIRATSGLAAPSLFGRDSMLDQDIEYIKNNLEKNRDSSPKQMIAGAYLLLGSYSSQKKSDYVKAKDYLTKSLELGKGTRYEEQAKKALAQLK